MKRNKTIKPKPNTRPSKRSSQPTGAKHRHAFKLCYFSVNEICEQCSCGKRRYYRPSAAQQREFRSRFFGQDPRRNVHRVWHRYCRQVLAKKREQLGAASVKFAKRYPGHVRIVGCDDSHFCSSDLVLIEHKAPGAHMGTTVVFIPECTGAEPTELFLYPSHLRALIAALQSIERSSSTLQALEEKRDRAWSRRFQQLGREQPRSDERLDKPAPARPAGRAIKNPRPKNTTET